MKIWRIVFSCNQQVVMQTAARFSSHTVGILRYRDKQSPRARLRLQKAPRHDPKLRRQCANLFRQRDPRSSWRVVPARRPMPIYLRRYL